MSMLSQQIRRATYSRRGTAAALIPPHTFSRLYSTNNRVPGPENVWGDLLKNVLAITFMLGSFHWVDYGGYRTRAAERKKINAEFDQERNLLDKVQKELDDLRKKPRTVADI